MYAEKPNGEEWPTPNEEMQVEYHTVPDGVPAKLYSLSLSAKHGDRLSNGDLKKIAEAEFEQNPKLDPTAWGKGLGISKSTVYRWVSHLVERDKLSRLYLATWLVFCQIYDEFALCLLTMYVQCGILSHRQKLKRRKTGRLPI
jgi:hypothetical protein